MRKRALYTAAAAALFGSLWAAPKAHGQDKKVTVAVLTFKSSAMVKRDQYDALADGIPLLLGFELVTHPSIHLVERENLDKVLNELQLSRSETVDPQTAVKIGKLLNAQYLVLGGFVVDPKETMQLTARVIEVETSLVKSATKVTGKGQDIFELVSKLTIALSPLLNISPPKGRERPSEASASDDNVQAVGMYVFATHEEALGNKTEAIRLAKNAMRLSRKIEPDCRELLARLGAS